MKQRAGGALCCGKYMCYKNEKRRMYVNSALLYRFVTLLRLDDSRCLSCLCLVISHPLRVTLRDVHTVHGTRRKKTGRAGCTSFANLSAAEQRQTTAAHCMYGNAQARIGKNSTSGSKVWVSQEKVRRLGHFVNLYLGRGEPFRTRECFGVTGRCRRTKSKLT